MTTSTSPSVLVAPYSFKGTLTASDAASVMVNELRRQRPAWRARAIPLADGGRGTMEALAEALGGLWRTAPACDALGRPTNARWVELPAGKAAFEVAEVIGYDSIPADRRDPGALTTRGVGMVLRAIADAGLGDVIVGLGDSATHDCGIGLAAELGYRFIDRRGATLEPVGHSLSRITDIDESGVPRKVRDLNIVAFCDVLNPLLGLDGAALCFAPQKGADGLQVQELEEGSRGFAGAVARELGRLMEQQPGAGAAGGIGAGLAGLFDAQLAGGADAVLDAVRFDEHATAADVILTGEGRLDRQTFLGKGVARVAGRARSVERSCVVFAGQMDGPGVELERRLGARIVPLSSADEGALNRDDAAARLAEGVTAWVASTSRSMS